MENKDPGCERSRLVRRAPRLDSSLRSSSITKCTRNGSDNSISSRRWNVGPHHYGGRAHSQYRRPRLPANPVASQRYISLSRVLTTPGLVASFSTMPATLCLPPKLALSPGVKLTNMTCYSQKLCSRIDRNYEKLATTFRIGESLTNLPGDD